ncbi:MAG: hypothetical protein ACE5I9_04065 [Candidatus Methylomirabilales bacterium]
MTTAAVILLWMIFSTAAMGAEEEAALSAFETIVQEIQIRVGARVGGSPEPVCALNSKIQAWETGEDARLGIAYHIQPTGMPATPWKGVVVAFRRFTPWVIADSRQECEEQLHTKPIREETVTKYFYLFDAAMNRWRITGTDP